PGAWVEYFCSIFPLLPQPGKSLLHDVQRGMAVHPASKGRRPDFAVVALVQGLEVRVPHSGRWLASFHTASSKSASRFRVRETGPPRGPPWKTNQGRFSNHTTAFSTCHRRCRHDQCRSYCRNKTCATKHHGTVPLSAPGEPSYGVLSASTLCHSELPS